MKKYFITALAVLSITVFTSCNDTNDNDPEVMDGAYPVDVEGANAAVYNVLYLLASDERSEFINNPFYWWSIMSDDCYGSGSLQDNVAKSLHHFTTASANQYEYDFLLLYGGVMRANYLIETIEGMEWTSENMSKRNQLLGEGYFMRGFYNLLYTQLFGDVPLYTTTEITDDWQIQVDAEHVIYPQIIADFISAKNLMKAERANGSGHADKFAAESFLARAWMFWAGFYRGIDDLSTEDATMQLLDRNGELIQQEGLDVTSVSKADVIGFLKDVVATGGYKLCEDFRSLWQYSNSLLWDEAHDSGVKKRYEFINDMQRANCFDQPGMGNGNTEEIFQIQFTNEAFNPQKRSNALSRYWGLLIGASNDNGRRDKTYPFNQGLGQGTPSCNIWDDWTQAEEKGGYSDIRKLGSMIDLDNELDGYVYEKNDCEESGYAVKKYADVNLWANAQDNDSWWLKYPGASQPGNSQQNNCFEDFYLMRYADVLLMLSELTGDVVYMNQVQLRAHVPLTGSYSLEALQNERRWEFAFEGLRFNDMRRWSGVTNHSKSSYAVKALEAQGGKLIVCLGNKEDKRTMEHMTSVGWAKRYADTKGFLPKPQTQINIMNGNLVQNPGWDDDTPSKEWTYRVLY